MNSAHRSTVFRKIKFKLGNIDFYFFLTCFLPKKKSVQWPKFIYCIYSPFLYCLLVTLSVSLPTPSTSEPWNQFLELPGPPHPPCSLSAALLWNSLQGHIDSLRGNSMHFSFASQDTCVCRSFQSIMRWLLLEILQRTTRLFFGIALISKNSLMFITSFVEWPLNTEGDQGHWIPGPRRRGSPVHLGLEFPAAPL